MPEIKTSAILYTSSIVMVFLGTMMAILDMFQRSLTMEADTLIELWEWTPFTEWGVILLGLGLYHFMLGLLADRRQA